MTRGPDCLLPSLQGARIDRPPKPALISVEHSHWSAVVRRVVVRGTRQAPLPAREEATALALDLCRIAASSGESLPGLEVWLDATRIVVRVGARRPLTVTGRPHVSVFSFPTGTVLEATTAWS